MYSFELGKMFALLNVTFKTVFFFLDGLGFAIILNIKENGLIKPVLFMGSVRR